MDSPELLVFAICILTASFIAGAMEGTKGVPLKKRLLCWATSVPLTAVLAFFLMQVVPDGETTVSIYSSSDQEKSLVGPISAAVFFVLVVAVGWLGKQLGKVLKAKMLGGNRT